MIQVTDTHYSIIALNRLQFKTLILGFWDASGSQIKLCLEVDSTCFVYFLVQFWSICRLDSNSAIKILNITKDNVTAGMDHVTWCMFNASFLLSHDSTVGIETTSWYILYSWVYISAIVNALIPTSSYFCLAYMTVACKLLLLDCLPNMFLIHLIGCLT